ncbi:hypothetical protein [Dictyobacter kobayashii]|uniref:hypothetical protein n=1 Tax=Dictyobacter kobayashii TaxID=2014872 RepID=UPI000F83B953|nr:hypothetical protein [Dictyobacter kobayashii]
MKQGQGGPQRIYERVALYIEEEQALGTIRADVDAQSVAVLLLGACFQYVFLKHFIGAIRSRLARNSLFLISLRLSYRVL